MDTQKQKEAKKRWNNNNKDKLILYHKIYYQKNKDKILEHTREYRHNYYIQNKEKIQKKAKEYFHKNRQKINKYIAKYLKEHPEKKKQFVERQIDQRKIRNLEKRQKIPINIRARNMAIGQDRHFKIKYRKEAEEETYKRLEKYKDQDLTFEQLMKILLKGGNNENNKNKL